MANWKEGSSSPYSPASSGNHISPGNSFTQFPIGSWHRPEKNGIP